jgi:hypothetical protein
METTNSNSSQEQAKLENHPERRMFAFENGMTFSSEFEGGNMRRCE